MNDAVGPEGLVPSMLVFGAVPRFPPHSTPLLSHEDRMKAMQVARTQMADITAELRIARALRAQLPPASKYMVNPGDQVYVHHEKDKNWKGPYNVVRTFDKMVWVNRPDKEAMYRIDHVLPAKHTPDNIFINHFSSTCKQWTRADESCRIFLTEILKPGDYRADDPKFEKAIDKELKGLEREVYEIVIKEDVPQDANVLGCRIVLTIKIKDTDQELYKARLVAQGHRDREKHKLVHPSTTLRHSSIRLLTAIAEMFGFRVWSQDVTQAYLQSADKVMRDVYLKPSKEFKLDKNRLLKLLKPLYGLSDDAGDYWDATIMRHLKEDLNMSQSALDICFF